jgi:ribosomal protein S18 acetylase RimI-like enzyme
MVGTNQHGMKTPMEIIPSKLEDVDVIFELYDAATAYQRTVTKKWWQGFERSTVVQEIREGRHFVIKAGDDIACTFVLTFNDPVIWKEADADPAIYIHRIATNAKYRGSSFVQQIATWLRAYGQERNKGYIRLDTHSGNERLNKHYIRCGFTFVGTSAITWTDDLPEHYKDGPFSLFEIALK